MFSRENRPPELQQIESIKRERGTHDHAGQLLSPINIPDDASERLSAVTIPCRDEVSQPEQLYETDPR